MVIQIRIVDGNDLNKYKVPRIELDSATMRQSAKLYELWNSSLALS